MNWILFSSQLIELSFDTRIRTEIVATDNFSGVLRLAFIPPTAAFGNDVNAGNSTVELLRLSESSGLKTLVYHAGIYPTGGGVSWDIKTVSVTSPSIASSALKAITSTITITQTDKGKTGTVYFKFDTQMMNPNSNSKLELLMLGLPHHADVLSVGSMLPKSQFDLDFWSIKGKMVPVVGATWSYDEKLTDTQFDRVADINVAPDVANLILQNIKADMDLFPTVKTLNIYGYGKQVARLAQLAHIAKMVTKQSNTTSGILREITGTLYDSLSALLDGKIADELLYDAKFGGIVSKNGLLNVNEDFGNGRYNDHHFHYG
jgi:endoglucanase Acf2